MKGEGRAVHDAGETAGNLRRREVTRILLPGRTGQVGWHLQSALAPLGEVLALDRSQMDLTDAASVRAAIRKTRPDVIVNAAGYTTVDKAESEPGLATQVNGVAPGIMAEEAKRIGALLVHYSTDYVFDGELGRPYTEEDAPSPVNTYGISKLAGERAIAEVGGEHLILRTSWIYGEHRPNFVLAILRLARQREELAVVDDQSGSPSWARELASATADLLRAQSLYPPQSGVYHLAAGGSTSRYEFARTIIELAREVSRLHEGWANVKPIASDGYPLPAKRPRHAVTSKDRIKRVFGVEMPHWEAQLRGYLRELISTVDWEQKVVG